MAPESLHHCEGLPLTRQGAPKAKTRMPFRGSVWRIEFGNQGRRRLEQIPHLKEGGFPVFVNGYTDFGIPHSRQMLNGT